MLSVNITKQVIDSLCKQSPEFNLFFKHHFEIKEKQSLTPRISRGKASFPVETQIVPKKKSFEEKMKYYQADMDLANKKNKYYPMVDIIIRFWFEGKE